MDKIIYDALCMEKERQENNIELIASENYASKDILELDGSILTNKYAEGIIKMINNYDNYNSDKIKNYAFSNYDKSVICKKIIDICNETIEK